MKNSLYFQYCPKIILLSDDKKQVLLAKRRDEQDYDGTYSFIGGKTETTDESLITGLKREKEEEIGTNAKIKICWKISCYQVLFRKKDGSSMIIPHHPAVFVSGDVNLNQNEYSNYRWISIDSLRGHEPKVENIPDAVEHALRLVEILKNEDFEEI